MIVDYVMIGLAALMIFGDLTAIILISKGKISSRFVRFFSPLNASVDLRNLSTEKQRTIRIATSLSLAINIMIILLIVYFAITEIATEFVLIGALLFFINQNYFNWYMIRLIKRN